MVRFCSAFKYPRIMPKGTYPEPSIFLVPRSWPVTRAFFSCYIGHYSSLGAMLLNQLGYEAYSLAWGLASWNIEAMGEGTIGAITEGSGFEVEK